MKYLSVCSGIEAATTAWHHMGWNPVAFSEIEKFPSEVLSHHYPNVPNLGDMTKFKEWNLNDSIGLLVGGTPCQSFSVAGLRKGLEDPRGNLALIYCGILDKFKPKWFLWENVPGVLSSGGGRDFGSFLGAVAELGYGFAYRVLDAQYFGVAQRRRRVFVVGYLGDWRPAAKVLFESESLRRDTPPSRSKREEVTARTGIGPEISGPLAARRFAETDGLSTTSAQMIAVPPVANCLQTSCNDYSRADGFNMIALAENTIGRQPHNGGNGDGFTVDGPMYTLNATGVHGVSYGFEPGIAKREGDPNRFVEEMTPTLRAGMGDNQTAVAVIPFDTTQITSPQNFSHPKPNDPCHPLTAHGHTPAIAIGVDTYNGTESGDVAVTMTAAGGSSTHSGPKVMVDNQVISWDSELNPNVDKMGTLMRGGQGGRMDGVMHNMAVRRLTPMECERLQGFPDSYTDIKPKGKPTPDGPRYKALGNSMAVPVMKWIGERINQYEKGEL
jgi:DNA (cytosine-5)-methyltransferase 1